MLLGCCVVPASIIWEIGFYDNENLINANIALFKLV